MLQLIRDRATGWIAWAIILLICISFALIGANQYFEPDQGLVVATVDDSEISYPISQCGSATTSALAANVWPEYQSGLAR